MKCNKDKGVLSEASKKSHESVSEASKKRLFAMSEAGYGTYNDFDVEYDDATLHVKAGENLSRVIILDSTCEELNFDHIVVEQDARVNVVFIIFPDEAKITEGLEIPLTVDLVGEHSEAVCSGVFLARGNSRVKILTNLVHRSANCCSRQLFNGMAADNAKGEFFGKITVAPDAQKTEAYQENHNLLLSDDAAINTKPQLEIYADDVKCNHGATLGRLNEDEQFYMRSRGIPLEEAKVLQMLSFMAPVLGNIEDEELRANISSRIEQRVRKMIV